MQYFKNYNLKVLSAVLLVFFVVDVVYAYSPSIDTLRPYIDGEETNRRIFNSIREICFSSYVETVRTALGDTNPSRSLWRFLKDMIDMGKQGLIPYLYEFFSETLSVEEIEALAKFTIELFMGISIEECANQKGDAFESRTMPVVNRTKDQPLIMTLTLNACLDASVDFSMFPAQVGQCQPDAYDLEAGGKGINISVGLKKWEVDELVTCGLIGGPTGAIMINQLEKQGISTGALTQIAEATRINLTVHNGFQDLIHTESRGHTAVSSQEIERLRKSIWQYLRKGDFLLVAGSLPKGVPEDFHCSLIRELKDAGIKTYVDTREPWLKHAINGRPHFLGVNLVELATYLHVYVNELRENPGRIVYYIEPFVHAGIDVVVISMGKKGMLMTTPHGSWRAYSPPREEISSVAAGDTIKVAFAYAELQNMSYLEALQLATAASAVTVSKKGSVIASLREAEMLYNKISIEIVHSSPTQNRTNVNRGVNRGERCEKDL